MCGIAGLVTLGQESVIENVTSVTPVMCKSLEHRNPGYRETYITDQLALGFERLSILDLTYSRHQPMDGRKGYVLINNENTGSGKSLHKASIRELSQIQGAVNTMALKLPVSVKKHPKTNYVRNIGDMQ